MIGLPKVWPFWPLYRLDGHEVVVAPDVEQWAEWMTTADRVVGLMSDGGVQVSTVFVGLDLRHGRGGVPFPFETMVFNADGTIGECRRYATWDEAEAGHREIAARFEP